MRYLANVLAFALLCGVTTGCTQSSLNPPEPAAPAVVKTERPIPYPVSYPVNYQRALRQETRASTGLPGPKYWQQWSEYTLVARIQPESRRLEGEATIIYHNNSPDSLRLLFLNLYQNLHAEGAPRSIPQEVTGGVELTRVRVDGQQLALGADEGPRYDVFATIAVLRPEVPLGPGATATIEVDWAFDIPNRGASGRMGWRDDNLFFMAYWYPQMAVYDDVVGWQNDVFMGGAEFYAGFGSYDLTVEVPEGWIVISTGTLQNPEKVLAPNVVERLRQAELSDDVVHVITADDFGPNGTAKTADGILRWRFVADSVRDVAFSVSRESFWDAARAQVGDRDGDGQTDYTRIDALYRKSAPRWENMVRYGQHSISFLSEFTGIQYPWPHMTAVESGAPGSGMEYPMMTLIGNYNQAGDSALYYVTAHELAHMWVPMIVSNDERRYSWMDEGTTTFHENQASKDFFPGVNFEIFDQMAYLGLARADLEGEMMRRSDYHYPGAFGIASYQKPATVLVALRGVLGAAVFNQALRAFLSAWAFKHPYPWDMFNAFESASGRDLDWFWRSWYYETWTLDQAVASVAADQTGTRIVIEDLGLVPMPVKLTITRSDGEVLEREIPVDSWLSGAKTASLTVPLGAPVIRVEIDRTYLFPDINRGNNVWTR